MSNPSKSGRYGRVLHFRSTPELDELLDAMVQRLRDEGTPATLANRSAVCRTLLMQNLNDADRQEVMAEIIKSAWGIMQRSLGTTLRRVLEEMAQEVDLELEALDEAV